MPGGRAAAAAGAREGGAFASAVPTVLDPSLAERGRLLRAAVATIVQALGEQGVTYRRHLHTWMEGLGPSDRILRALPPAVRMAGNRLPASPPGLRSAHKEFVKTVDRLRKSFRTSGPAPRVFRLTKADSLTSAVCGGERRVSYRAWTVNCVADGKPC